MTDPAAAQGVSRRRARPSRGPLLLFLLLVAAVLGGLYVFARPQLELINDLAGQVRLVIDGAEPRTVPPHSSVRVSTPWSGTVVATWELTRPLSAGGQAMGEEIRGSQLLRGKWGTIRLSVKARGSAGDYFAPLITNGSADLLRVTVNAGLEGALDCGCAIRPDARRVFIGYYRLYQNSTVQARATGGRSAAFRDLGPKVLAPDGTLGLRFEDRDLRRP